MELKTESADFRGVRSTGPKKRFSESFPPEVHRFPAPRRLESLLRDEILRSDEEMSHEEDPEGPGRSRREEIS